VALVTAEVPWLRLLLEDFGVSVSRPTPLLSDTTSAISIARDPVKHEFAKNIGVDASYTRAQVQNDVIALQYRPGHEKPRRPSRKNREPEPNRTKPRISLPGSQEPK